jgi:MFS family permease
MGTLGVFGALGLARFGYTTILPAMQTDLGINNEQAGLLATLNLSGYLTMSVIGGMLASRYGARTIISAGLLLAGAAMIMTGMAQGYGSLIIWRLVTGLGSGAANVSIMGLLSSWFTSKKRGLASGVAVSGSSVALIFTGIFVPRILDANGAAAWRSCWFLYGAITGSLALCSYLILRNSAREKGECLVGENNDTSIVKQPDKRSKLSWRSVYRSAPLWFLGFIYMTCGFSYIIYITFFVKYLVSEHGYTSTSAGDLFMIIGWISLLCGLAWGAVSDRIGRKSTIVILFLINTVSFSLFAIGTTPLLLTMSAVIYGFSAWSIPAIMAAACGDMLGRDLAPAALGFITLFFGIGQAGGPVAAGIIADASGSFSPALMLAAAVSLLGALATAMLVRNDSGCMKRS